MPEARPMQATANPGDFDDPPAGRPSYPNRHVRLRRALRDTSALAREIQRDTPVSAPPAPTYWPRREAALRRARRRAREAELDDEIGGIGYGAALLNPDESGRRAKRRKLDSPPSTKPPIKYGTYGQVEPGTLQMEIISNDGGEHIDPSSPTMYLGENNLLLNDKSVYCSERSSAGITLRHADATPFTLEKLHVVGPEHGFTAPVRQGLVYVAMELKDLEPYRDPPPYARRAGIDTPPYHRQRPVQPSEERLSLQEALRDEEINRTVPPPRRAHPLIDSSSWLQTPSSRESPQRDDPDAEPICIDTHNPSANPIAISSDDEPSSEQDSPQEVLDYRIRRLRLMRRQTQVYYDGPPALESVHLRSMDSAWSTTQLETLMSHRTRPQNPDPETSKVADASAKDPHVVSARFKVRQGKHRVALKFSPPVSGRYVLVKLWAGGGGENVDVQSVVLKGFAGPRFFEAVAMA